MEVIGKELNLIKKSNVGECDLKTLFAKQVWMRIFDAMIGLCYATFLRRLWTQAKVVRSATEEKETEICSFVIGIDIILTQPT